MKNKFTRREFIKKTARTGTFLSLAGTGLIKFGCSAGKEYDILISGGIVYDGSGNPGKEADVGIKGDMIKAIGNNLNKDMAREVIDAKGLAVAPGFIDAHSHTARHLLVNPKAESKIRQGVTTEISGNCGGSPFPVSVERYEERMKKAENESDRKFIWKDLNGFFARLEEYGMALNHATLVGHGTIRRLIMGSEDRQPTGEELSLMKKAVRENMRAGAVGISTGLYYAPGSFAVTDEVVELCRELVPFKGVYATHMRDEGDFLLEAMDEAITIAREAGVSVEISHFKTMYPRNFSKIDAMLKKIEDAEKEGIPVLADRYPYSASSTSLSAFFPRWTQQGKTEDFLAQLQDKSLEGKIRAHLEKIEEKLKSWDRVVISGIKTEKNKRLEGKNILQAAAEANKSCYDFIRDLLIEEENGVDMINFSMDEDNLKRVLAHPLVVIGSDGYALAPYGELSKGKPHLRNYGSFPRVLGKYAREEKIFPLEIAVRKMTSLTAEKFGLAKRGWIKEGYFADLVLFDPDRVIDNDDWLNPHQYPAGIEYVLVNGRIVINRGRHTGTLPGRVLRNQAI